MSNDASNVSVGKPLASGAIFVAPSGTTAPTDAKTALAATFKCVGYISEDGVTNAIKTDTTPTKAWGGVAVNTVQTSREETFKFKMIEINEDSLEQAFGKGNVTKDSASGAITIKHNGNERAVYVYVIETVLSAERIKRVVIPNGKVTELGDIVYNDSDPIGYEVTVAASPDANQNTAYEYIAKTTTAGV
ncbi:phage tail tube protein [Eubacterium sp.]|uniref:phage tail tube protein n=1 Tax=Eubacterium sp. TaxID=142586 RepID=UPI002FC8A664